MLSGSLVDMERVEHDGTLFLMLGLDIIDKVYKIIDFH